MNEDISCIFCNIVEGKIPKYVVHESEYALAFLDIFPCSKGHTVVVPKIHAKNLFELDDEGARHVMDAVRATMKRLKDVLGCEGFSVGFNHGEAGGQSIWHLHIHVMPRWEGDGGGNMHSIIKNPGDMAVEDIAKLFEV